MKRIFTLLVFVLPISLLAQQVAVIGLNNFSFGGLRDGFAFVALEDIPDGTKIYFTEEDYDEPNDGFILPVVGEAVQEWTASGVLSQGCVVSIHEVSPNSGQIVASSMGCNAGSVTGNFGSFSIGTNDPIYAFSSSGGATADAILGNLTEIFSVMFIDDANLSSSQNPINDYPNAIVVDLSVDGGGAHFTPSLRANQVSSVDLTNSANYFTNVDGIDPLDATIFANLSDDPCAGIGDADMDGTCDDVDGCPNDPNKTEPGLCGCGVADDDSDMDGTPDCNDNCPNDPNKTEPGLCGCGVADTDSDMDGTPDCNDGCPNDPNKTAPGDCGCGVADDDADMDGTPDCNDNCPNDPNKTEPGDCGCGNPEPGAACDDGDSCTINDTVQADCSCVGISSDTEAPVLICNTVLPPVAADANCMAIVNDLTMITMAVDDCDAMPVLTQMPAAMTMVGLGNNTITVFATDASGNQDSCTYTLTVEDMMPPTISCPDDIVVAAETGFCDTLINFTAPVGMSACSDVGTAQTEGLESGDFFPLGVNTITFQTTAANGMTASCSFTITVNDEQAPIFTCADVSLSLDSLSGEVALDLQNVVSFGGDCEPLLDPVVSGPGIYNCDHIGENMETLMLTDTSGNSATCTFTVTIDAGEFECNPDNTQDLLDIIQLEVYPNPAREQVIVEIKNELVPDIQLSLWDAVGRNIPLDFLQARNGFWQLNVQDLPRGVYWLRLSSAEQGAGAKRIIIQ